MEVSSSDDAEKWKGALGEDQAHKVKVDEHATQHPIGVVDHVVDKRPLPLTFACIVQSPAAVECVRSLLEAGAEVDKLLLEDGKQVKGAAAAEGADKVQQLRLQAHEEEEEARRRRLLAARDEGRVDVHRRGRGRGALPERAGALGRSAPSARSCSRTSRC